MDVGDSFEPWASATLVHYVCDSHYKNWIFRFLGPISKRVAHKKLEADFKRLKELLES